MRLQPLTICFLICLLTTQNLPAQIGDWRDVASRPEGTPIYIVSKRHHRPCTLIRVTNDRLLCEEGSGHWGSRVLEVPRQELQEVREVQANPLRTAIGTTAGAGVCRSFIKSNDAETQVYGTVGCAVLGGIAGAVIGRISAQIHSKVIYKR